MTSASMDNIFSRGTSTTTLGISDEEDILAAYSSGEDLGVVFDPVQEGPLPYESHIHPVAAVGIKCQHDAMPLVQLQIGSKPGFWLPYVRVRRPLKYDKVTTLLTNFFIKELKLTPKESNKSKTSFLFEKLILHTHHRIQLPNGEFVERTIYLARWRDSEENCCTNNTSRIRWIPIKVAAESSAIMSALNSNQPPPKGANQHAELISRFWGSEVAEVAALTLQARVDRLLNIKEQTTDQVFKYFFSSSRSDSIRSTSSARANAEIVQFVAQSQISKAQVVKVYSDFVQHCYPALDMSCASFKDYCHKIGLLKTKDDVFVHNAFRATNYREPKNYIAFNQFFLGLLCLDPNSPHTVIRDTFIFRFYDQNSDGVLNREELGRLAVDLKNKDLKLPTQIEITDPRELSKLGDLSALCRFTKSVIQAMHNENAYELIQNKSNPDKPFDAPVQATCPKCRPKNLSIAPHSVKMNQKHGRVDDHKPLLADIPASSMATALSNLDLSISRQNDGTHANALVRQHSLEHTFKLTSNANYVLHLVRRMANINRMSDSKRKEVRSQVINGLTVEVIHSLCNEVAQIFAAESRVLAVNTPIYVLGDIHGNINDLLTFETQLWPAAPAIVAANVLFLGDFVDRGEFSIEVACYLFALKILAPIRFSLLRGNHEVRAVQKLFTFEKECKEKYGSSGGASVWEKLNSCFDAMPFAAIVDEKIFCAHGGVPKSMTKIEELNAMPAIVAEPERNALAIHEILWADPMPPKEYAEVASFLKKPGDADDGFLPNTKRSTGFFFSDRATTNFLNVNGLSHVIRAHEVVPLGYRFDHGGSVITIFSCSHYCGGNNEAAAVLIEAYGPEGFIKIISLETV